MKTLAAGLASLLFVAGSAAAQELEPRAYAPSPVGTTFIIWLPLRQQHPHQAGTEPAANAR